jgi:hypothetical protein
MMTFCKQGTMDAHEAIGSSAAGIHLGEVQYLHP